MSPVGPREVVAADVLAAAAAVVSVVEWVVSGINGWLLVALVFAGLASLDGVRAARRAWKAQL